MIKLYQISLLLLGFLAGQSLGGYVVANNRCNVAYYCISGDKYNRYGCSSYNNAIKKYTNSTDSVKSIGGITLGKDEWTDINICKFFNKRREVDKTTTKKSCWPNVNLRTSDEKVWEEAWTMEDVRGGFGITNRGFCLKGNPWQTKKWYSLFRKDCSVVTCNTVLDIKENKITGRTCSDMKGIVYRSVSVPLRKQISCTHLKDKLSGERTCGRTVRKEDQSAVDKPVDCVYTTGNWCYSFQEGWCIKDLNRTNSKNEI